MLVLDSRDMASVRLVTVSPQFEAAFDPLNGLLLKRVNKEDKDASDLWLLLFASDLSKRKA